MSHRAPKANTESEPKSSPAGRADRGKGSEASGSDELAGASGGGGTEGAEPPSSADASRCSDTKGKEACAIEEAEEDLKKDGGARDASTGRHGMTKGACLLEDGGEELKKRIEKSITLKEMESPDIEMENKFACGDIDEDEECVSALADKDLLSPQFDDILDEQKYIVLKELDSKTVMSRIDKIMSANLDTISEGKGYSFYIPKRGTIMMTYHEGHQQLVIERGDTVVREFYRDETMHMATVTVVVLSKIFQVLKGGVTITNHDLFCSRKDFFQKIEILDAVLYDVCCMLGCTMSSLNVISIAKGSVIGPLTLRFKNGYSVNCLEKPLEGMRIPNNALEAEIEIEKHAVDFILVLEKSSLFDHLCQMDFHTENKCIMITGDGKPDIATQVFLKMLVDVTHLKAYALVDPDAYGVQALCTYAFGSTEVQDESLGFAVPSICWLGILPGDLASLTELECSHFPNFSLKEQRVLTSVLRRRRMVLPNMWIQMIEQLAFENTKASFEYLHSLGFGYLSKVFIPKLLQRKEMQTSSGVSEVTGAEERVDP